MIQMIRRRHDELDRALLKEFQCEMKDHYGANFIRDEDIYRFIEARKPSCTCDLTKHIADWNCPVHEYLD
jgi:hypothetical protein